MKVSVALVATLSLLLGSVSGATNRAQLRQQLLEEGWLQFGDSFYKEGDERTTWDEARKDCPTKHHLASLSAVQTLEEHHFLVNTFGTSQWIGLNDIDIENTFTWVNGDPVIFTNWAPGQPDNDLAQQDCVLLSDWYTGLWDDDDCKLIMTYACEVEL